MSQPSGINDHEKYRLQGKGLDPDQVLSGWDWAVTLPTHKLVSTKIVSPEKLVHLFKSFSTFSAAQAHRCPKAVRPNFIKILLFGPF